MYKFLNTLWGILGGLIGFCYGQLNGLIYALVAFIVIDYITGVMVAICRRKLSSFVGFKGIFKKILILALVAVGHIIDAQILGGGAVIMSAVTLFYLANEGISILENTGNLGLPLPKKLKDILEQIKSESEE